MEHESGLSQLIFLTTAEFSFGIGPIMKADIPEKLKPKEDVYKIVSYNNVHKGIIDNDFFVWALENGISYEVVKWFINDFANENDKELNDVIDALFNKYTLYLDESGNCVKFRFKSDDGNTNSDWFNDFVLSGIVVEGESDWNTIDQMFKAFRFQKNVVDAKLGSIAKYNGLDSDRFIDILKSDKVSLLLDTLLKSDNMYIHWATQNLLYYSLVDIIDSVFEMPFMVNETKNVLYNHVLLDIDYFLGFLAKYDYPNIKEEKIHSFCNEFIDWIDTLQPEEDRNEEFVIELLRQDIKAARRKKDLLFLQNNTDKLLIENFVPVYGMRISNFPNSILHFDCCSIVEENIEEYSDVVCPNKKPKYDFINSSNRFIQLSDMIAGITGAFMAFLNVNDVVSMLGKVTKFNDIQNKNLKIFICLREKSSKKNKYFDNMSMNFRQFENMKILQAYCEKYI